MRRRKQISPIEKKRSPSQFSLYRKSKKRKKTHVVRRSYCVVGDRKLKGRQILWKGSRRGGRTILRLGWSAPNQDRDLGPNLPLSKLKNQIKNCSPGTIGITKTRKANSKAHKLSIRRDSIHQVPIIKSAHRKEHGITSIDKNLKSSSPRLPSEESKQCTMSNPSAY